MKVRSHEILPGFSLGAFIPVWRTELVAEVDGRPALESGGINNLACNLHKRSGIGRLRGGDDENE